jgi:hypothetical protein
MIYDVLISRRYFIMQFSVIFFPPQPRNNDPMHSFQLLQPLPAFSIRFSRCLAHRKAATRRNAAGYLFFDALCTGLLRTSASIARGVGPREGSSMVAQRPLSTLAHHYGERRGVLHQSPYQPPRGRRGRVSARLASPQQPDVGVEVLSRGGILELTR